VMEEGTEEQPIPLDDEGKATLKKRMGRWIISACPDKKLAFALAFPFVRRPLALDSVMTTSLENMGVGFVPIIRGADLPIMTLNQAKMLLQIAAAYGQPLDLQRVKEIVAIVAGAFLCRNLARRLVIGAIPVIGWAVKGAIGFGATEAVGHACIEYFEEGGDLTGLANIVEKARDGAVDLTTKAINRPAAHKVLDGAKGLISRHDSHESQPADA
ncbi:MAG: hypothetical protein LUB61_03250, partial [Eggerthellaceae bacterium]|nr:hypothetical protein [Eggerthellaceae bacterium]